MRETRKRWSWEKEKWTLDFLSCKALLQKNHPQEKQGKVRSSRNINHESDIGSACHTVQSLRPTKQETRIREGINHKKVRKKKERWEENRRDEDKKWRKRKRQKQQSGRQEVKKRRERRRGNRSRFQMQLLFTVITSAFESWKRGMQREIERKKEGTAREAWEMIIVCLLHLFLSDRM